MASEDPTRPPSESDLSTPVLRNLIDRVDDVEDEQERADRVRSDFAAKIHALEERVDELEGSK